jgi:hypothetical protein
MDFEVFAWKINILMESRDVLTSLVMHILQRYMTVGDYSLQKCQKTV